MPNADLGGARVIPGVPQVDDARGQERRAARADAIATVLVVATRSGDVVDATRGVVGGAASTPDVIPRRPIAIP